MFAKDPGFGWQGMMKDYSSTNITPNVARSISRRISIQESHYQTPHHNQKL